MCSDADTAVSLWAESTWGGVWRDECGWGGEISVPTDLWKVSIIRTNTHNCGTSQKGVLLLKCPG